VLVKRRDFLKAPAAGVLLGGFGVAEASPGTKGIADPQEQKAQEAQQRMHPDFITYFPGIEYFYLGNGEIQGAVQYSPEDRRTSLVGFTMSNPEVFCRKWSTYLYHP